MLDAIGNTPLIHLKNLSDALNRNIFGKAEFMNPSGSVKDRAAKFIIEDKIKSGELQIGGTLVEGTGGNTGISLAMIGASNNYSVKIAMPENIAIEKQNLIKRFGGDSYLQPLVPFTNPLNYARFAEDLVNKEIKNGNDSIIFCNQFENLANFKSHYYGTGPEIMKDTNNNVTHFICSAGTGGTIAGISAYLKDNNPNIKSYLVDPDGSILHDHIHKKLNVLDSTEGNSKKNERATGSIMEGIGISRITSNFSCAKLDGSYQCCDQEAITMAYYLLKYEGLYLGPSAAMNVCGAVKLARDSPEGSNIVTILCDGGERYSSKIYNEDWLKEHNFHIGLEYDDNNNNNHNNKKTDDDDTKKRRLNFVQ